MSDTKYVFLDSRLVPEEEAVVSVYDHGFLYGDGIYETMRSYDGTIFMLERHLGRLRRSASLIRLALPEEGFIRNALTETMSANHLSDAYIRITISRGKGPAGLDPDLCKEATVVIMARPFREYPEDYYEKGVKLIIAGTRRNSILSIDPKIKSLNFLNNILAKIEAKEQGAYEALMLNSEGYLAEGTVCNIFFVRERELCTPSIEAGILDGITREVVIGIALEKGVAVREAMFTPEDLSSASEVFLTNTTSEVMPVAAVGEWTFPVGELTQALRAFYKYEVSRYIIRK